MPAQMVQQRDSLLKSVYKVGDEEYMLFKLPTSDKEAMQSVQEKQTPANLKSEPDYFNALCGSKEDTEQDNESLMSLPDFNRSQFTIKPEIMV